MGLLPRAGQSHLPAPSPQVPTPVLAFATGKQSSARVKAIALPPKPSPPASPQALLTLGKGLLTISDLDASCSDCLPECWSRDSAPPPHTFRRYTLPWALPSPPTSNSRAMQANNFLPSPDCITTQPTLSLGQTQLLTPNQDSYTSN